MRFPAIETVTPQVTPQVESPVAKLLQALQGEMTRKELQQAFGFADKDHFRETVLKPALENGLIEMTIPEKPNSRLQRYRLTKKGEQKRKELTES